MIDLLAKAQAKGTDAEFRAWVQRQPSCLSGRYSEWLESGEGRNPACHVRRAASSGTGFKASYSCIPMTQLEHHLQHQHGEVGVLERFVPKIGGWTVEEAKDWFDRKVIEYRRVWVERN
ncbi:MAG: hypothetical protein BGO49_24545 [Planctomycetales bacterium 71-10]|nr:MAG: hypothetical protein BGO49_24545 [Planctomycetales bacterium 71-10]